MDLTPDELEKFTKAWEQAHPVNRALALGLLRFSGSDEERQKLLERLLGKFRKPSDRLNN